MTKNTIRLAFNFFVNQRKNVEQKSKHFRKCTFFCELANASHADIPQGLKMPN